MAIYEHISLEKGMYKPGGYGLTETLEKLDPSENYKGTPLEGLDAFQRQLKRFDIKVSGPNSDRIEKFFFTGASSALFPEYVSRAVRTGMQQHNVIDDIIAAKTRIDGMDYRSIASVPSDQALELKTVNEGATIPETNISIQANLVHLAKRGRMLTSSYEGLRFQRLDIFTVMLKQIGAYISKQLLSDAVTVLINGDGNSNAATSYTVNTSGTLTYADLVKLWGVLPPYDMTTIIANTAEVKTMLNMTEMKDSYAGHNFHATGNMITPLGAQLIHAPVVPAGKIIGLDKNYALEMVIAGDISTEYDKLIDKQMERTAISCIAGFSKIFKEASAVLSLT